MLQRIQAKRLVLFTLIFLSLLIPVMTNVCFAQEYAVEIKLVAFNFAPRRYAFCYGQLLSISEYTFLFSLIGTTYGGDGRTSFALPDLRGRVPIHAGYGPGLTPRNIGQRGGQERVTLSQNQIPSHSHSAQIMAAPVDGNYSYPTERVWAISTLYDEWYNNKLGNIPDYSDKVPSTSMASDAIVVGYTGGSQAHNNMPPYQGINYVISLVPQYFSESGAEPYLGEIRQVAFNFAPRGWALCDGQILPISQNQALFALLGTTYGGDGRTSIGLPDLRGRSPMNAGTGTGLTNRRLGEKGGKETVALTVNELPAHNHNATTHADPHEGNSVTPENNVWAKTGSGAFAYHQNSNRTMDSRGINIGPAGGSQPHENMPPYIGTYYIIALQGIFPPRN